MSTLGDSVLSETVNVADTTTAYIFLSKHSGGEQLWRTAAHLLSLCHTLSVRMKEVRCVYQAQHYAL